MIGSYNLCMPNVVCVRRNYLYVGLVWDYKTVLRVRGDQSGRECGGERAQVRHTRAVPRVQPDVQRQRLLRVETGPTFWTRVPRTSFFRYYLTICTNNLYNLRFKIILFYHSCLLLLLLLLLLRLLRLLLGLLLSLLLGLLLCLLLGLLLRLLLCLLLGLLLLLLLVLLLMLLLLRGQTVSRHLAMLLQFRLAFKGFAAI